MVSVCKIACMKRLALFFFGLSILAPVHAHKIVGIADGDTVTILVVDRPLKVKLANIDAPDKGQPFWRESKQSLAELCAGKDAEYREQDIDGHGNPVAIVMCDGIEVNRAQVERGMAWVSQRQNKDLMLPAVEAAARRERKGLWQDAAPVPPWEYRHPPRKARTLSRTQTSDGICYVDHRGEYRLVEGKRRAGCS